MIKFFKFYFRTNFPGWGVNYIWTFGSIAFFCLFLHGAYYRHDPVLAVLSYVPLIMLVYNLVCEYNIYRNLQVSTRLLAYIFYGAAAVAVAIAIGLIIN